MVALEKTGERKRGRITLRVDVVVAKSRRKSRVNQAEGGKIRHKSWPRFFPRPAFTLDGVGHRLDLSASGSQEWILHIDHGRPSVRFEYVRIHSKLAGAPQRMQGKKGRGGCYLCGMARVTYTQGGITFIRQPVAPFRPKVNSRLTRNGDLPRPFSPFDFLKVEPAFSPFNHQYRRYNAFLHYRSSLPTSKYNRYSFFFKLFRTGIKYIHPYNCRIVKSNIKRRDKYKSRMGRRVLLIF